MKPGTGNRFDSPSGNYGVRYFATTLDGCFGETLARFRPDPMLSEVIGDEWRKLGFMDVGDIPADWRQRRTAVRVGFPDGDHSAKFKDGVLFLDIELEELERRPIRGDDPSYKKIAKLYGLTPH